MQSLNSNPHLAELSDSEMSALGFAFVEAEYPDGRELIELGAPGKTVFALIEGVVDVVVPDGDTERVIATMTAGSLFGLLAVLDGAPSSAGCRARGPVRVGELTRHAFCRLEGIHAPIGYAFRRALGRQLAADFRRLVTGAGRRSPRRSGPSDRPASSA